MRLPSAALLRLYTTKPMAATMPLVMRSDGDGEVRSAPALVFCPPDLGKTDDFAAIPRAGDLGMLGPAATQAVQAAAANGDDDADAAEQRRQTEFISRVEAMLARDEDADNVTRFGESASDASYDFDEYVLLRDAAAAARAAGGAVDTAFDPQFRAFANEGRNGIAGFLEYSMLPLTGFGLQVATANAGSLRETLWSWWIDYCAAQAYNRLAQFSRSGAAAATGGLSLEVYYGHCLNWWLSSSQAEGAREFLLSDGARGLDDVFRPEFWEEARDAIFALYFETVPAADAQGAGGSDGLDFEPIPIDEALFGLRVIHRQTWHLLGYARGELVKTVPLGPREVQRVSIRIMRRRKYTRNSEEATSYETSQESGQTTKDTSEVVSEASDKLNKSLSADVSGGYGPFFQARISGSISNEVSQSSKETNSRLNEVMQKTASRMKRDTKLTVSTEREESYQEERSSELTNPNDEVAVTYLYHRLQQRHWVSTEIGEVQSVVFVPEPLPPVIDEDWVRLNADTIREALLDPDFAQVISAIRREPAALPRTDLARFDAAIAAGTNAIGDYRTFSGAGDLPDILASGQAFYERQYDRRNAADVDEARRRVQTDALLAHIRRNLLYYMRAIWTGEDRDRRLQRFSRMVVPVQWTFVPQGPLPPIGPATPGEVPGEFVPDMSSLRPLSEILDMTGPIGFFLNCSVYRLRDDPGLVNLHQALAYLRALYMRFEVNPSFVTNAGGLTVRQAMVLSPRAMADDFRILYSGARQSWLLRVPNRGEIDWPPVAREQDRSLQTLGIRLWIDGVPQDGDELRIRTFGTGELEDPHLRLIQILYPPPPPAQEAAVFTEELQRQILAVVPELAEDTGPVDDWASLEEPRRDLFRRFRARYLMLRDAGRLVALDTGNLVLELEISRRPALEAFKRLHREVDVLSAYEDLVRRNTGRSPSPAAALCKSARRPRHRARNRGDRQRKPAGDRARRRG
jgi:hypothetical protein